MLNIYIDETCQNNHHYMVIGGILLPASQEAEITRHFDDIKKSTNTTGEFKWTKISRAKLPVYKEFIDKFFDLADTAQLTFHSIIIDQTRVDHDRFNQGDIETGFSKFIYQLLVSSIGRKYAENYNFSVYLDYRTIKNQEARLTELRSVMNNGVSSRFAINSSPYKKVEFRRSKTTTLLQVTDLLLGAVGFHKNGRNLSPDASQHKINFANHIALRVGHAPLGRDTFKNEKKFHVWNFNLR